MYACWTLQACKSLEKFVCWQVALFDVAADPSLPELGSSMTPLQTLQTQVAVVYSIGCLSIAEQTRGSRSLTALPVMRYG